MTVRVPSSGSVVFGTSSAVVTITPHSFAFVPMGLRGANITRRRNSSSDEDEVSITIVFFKKATYILFFQDYVKAIEQQPPSYDQVVKDDLDAAKRSRY